MCLCFVLFFEVSTLKWLRNSAGLNSWGAQVLSLLHLVFIGAAVWCGSSNHQNSVFRMVYLYYFPSLCEYNIFTTYFWNILNITDYIYVMLHLQYVISPLRRFAIFTHQPVGIKVCGSSRLANDTHSHPQNLRDPLLCRLWRILDFGTILWQYSMT